MAKTLQIAGDIDLPPAEGQTKKFFFDILYRRLLYKVPDLEGHYGSPDVFEHATLVRDVFQNDHAANMLVRGCHGVSRDFIKAFNLATDYVEDDVARRPITLDIVNSAHGQISREVQENIHAADDIGGFLFEIVKPHLLRSGAPYFFLPRTEQRWDSRLWELVEKRALHAVPSEASFPIGADVEWKCYEISYGLFQGRSSCGPLSKRGDASRLRWSDAKKMPTKAILLHMFWKLKMTLLRL